jgi:hypothetical protein
VTGIDQTKLKNSENKKPVAKARSREQRFHHWHEGEKMVPKAM